jgi:UDP-N-acetylmuramate dehydrogenase
VGGPAALFVEAAREGDLLAIRRALGEHPVPVLVVGKGSNLLVADAGFPGLAVRLDSGAGSAFAEISEPQPAGAGDARILWAGAAVGLPVLARRSVEMGLSGLEWAVGVPGSVGGALRMNAGGHGSDVAANLSRYRWMDLCSEAGGEDGPEQLALSYRSSSLERGQIVLAAQFSVTTGSVEQGRATIAEIVHWRRVNQPGGSNAGSVFANPPDAAAGALIEAAGLKGTRLGTAVVSTKHANFIQADEGGSADDVWRLVEKVRSAVADRCGVMLRTELRTVGFEDCGEEA